MEKLLLTSITDHALNTQLPVVSKQMAYCISEKFKISVLFRMLLQTWEAYSFMFLKGPLYRRLEEKIFNIDFNFQQNYQKQISLPNVAEFIPVSIR